MPPSAGAHPAVDVFVSYARPDRVRAEAIMTALRNENFAVWWDPEINPGDDFRTALVTMLGAARCVVVLWSQASIESPWVIDEAERAWKLRKLIPACIDAVEPPIGFSGTQYAVLTTFTGDRNHPQFRKLCNAIQQKVDAHARLQAAVHPDAGAATAPVALEQASGAVVPERSSTAVANQGVPGASRPRWQWIAGGLSVGAILVAAAALVLERGAVKTGNDELSYRRIRAGQFTMGCDDCEPDERPAHRVTLTADFWLTETEVTVDAYRRFVMATERAMPPQTPRPEADPAQFNPGWRDGDHPIVNVSHQEATEYCRWAAGRFARGDLPTEAQWEYAARGGTSDLSFPWGNAISRDKANYGYKDPITGQIHARASERGGRDRWLFTSPVKSFDPNGFHLYDMVGNVQEWTRDSFRLYDPQPSSDPYAAPFSESPLESALAVTEERVVRGGSFLYDQDDSRVQNRSKNPPDGRYPDTGFRCALTMRRLW